MLLQFYGDEDEPLMFLTDLEKILGTSNLSRYVKDYDEDEVIKIYRN